MTGQKVKYVNFSREERSRDVKAALNLLGKARICCPVYASHCNGIPLFADIDENSYKLLFLDIGLMNHVCAIDWRTLQSMDNLELINKGALAEQYIGQHMAYPASSMDQPHPVYWIRESRAVNAEVDYVISNGQNIYPIEVKAGKSGRLRSLQQFCAIKKSPVAVRFDLNQPSRQQITHQVIIGKDNKSVTFELISLPLYAVTELERILSSHREPTHLYNC
jgi:predicted AAA+ superfamily ATPase